MAYEPASAFESLYYAGDNPLPDDFVARVHACFAPSQLAPLLAWHSSHNETNEPTTVALSILWEAVRSEAMTIEQACELTGTYYENLNSTWTAAGWSPLFPTVFEGRSEPGQEAEATLPSRVFP